MYDIYVKYFVCVCVCVLYLGCNAVAGNVIHQRVQYYEECSIYVEVKLS